MDKAKNIREIFPLMGYENHCLISKEKGCFTFPIKIKLKEVYTSDDKDIVEMNSLIDQIIDVLGANHLIHIQSGFLEGKVNLNNNRLQVARESEDFLSEYNELHFQNRKYTSLYSVMYITKTPKNYFKFSPSQVNKFLKKRFETIIDQGIPKEFLSQKGISEFYEKTSRIIKIINDSNQMEASRFEENEVIGEGGIIDRYMNLSFDQKINRDISFENEIIQVGEKRIQFFTLEDPDQLGSAYFNCKDYTKFKTDKTDFPVSNLFSLGFHFPYEHYINQYIYIAPQEQIVKTLTKRQKEFKRFSRDEEDTNGIYANAISSFKINLTKNHKTAVFYHLNVMAFTDNVKEQNYMISEAESAFNEANIKANINTIDRKNLYWAAFPGNSIGLSSEMYVPMTNDLASALIYLEGGYRDELYNVTGMRVTDRIQGKPVYLDLYRKRQSLGLIFNRNIVGLSGSGGGKSYTFNHYLYSEYLIGSYISILDAGKSYDGITSVTGGILLEHTDENPFSFNPFILDKYDFVLNNKNEKELSEGKIVFLFTLLNIISGGGYDNPQNMDEQLKYKIKEDILQKSIAGYYESMWDNSREDFKFDTFNEYIVEFLPEYVKEKNINDRLFDHHAFLSLLDIYKTGNLRGDLLNKKDSRFQNLSYERLVNFEVDSLIENDILFPIISLLVMDLFTKKLYDSKIQHINKIILVDEAWAAFDKRELEKFFLYLVKTARKKGGQTIFISQEPDDFIKSEVIKNSIINNSDIKIFLDMGKFKNNFEEIQSVMGITDKQKQLILSLNKDNREEVIYREACICWRDDAKVYGIETSKVEKALYETDPIEKKKINEKLEKYRKNWRLTAIDYAEAS